MDFTVIIATCDRPDRIGRVLERVQAAAQADGGRHVVIVVDNGTNHLAADEVRTFSEHSTMPVHYLVSPPRNKSRALNVGIAAADTEWLAFTDDDTLPDAGWLTQAALFAGRGLCRVFGGRIMAGPAPGRLPAWLRRGPAGRIPHGGVSVEYTPLPASGILRESDPVPFGANFFACKSVFKEHGNYDETLWNLCGKAALGVEDGEIGVRLLGRGEPIGYCHDVLVVHPVHLERASVWEHLRIAYRYGWRDPLVFFDTGRPFIEWFRFKRMAVLGVRSCAYWLSRDPAGAVADWVDIAKNWGSLCSRWSSQYRKWADIRERRSRTAYEHTCREE